MGMPLSIPTHHSEPADPELLEWIIHQVDALLGVGPVAMVVALGLVIVAIPVAVMAVFLLQRLRQSEE
jgi:hypothetical protein